MQRRHEWEINRLTQANKDAMRIAQDAFQRAGLAGELDESKIS
jgi:hypothetical protein